jgi:hypothetical protein
VTGERPRSGDGPPPSIDRLPDDVPAPIRAIVARALSSDPESRPTTASEMRAALVPEVVTIRRTARRNRRRLVIVALVLALVGTGIALAVTRPTTHAAPHTIVPRDGRWRGDPAGGTPWVTTLQRRDATTFAYENFNTVTGTGWRGVMTLERLSDGSTILSGKTADVPNCATCTNVGFVEFIVLSPTSLYQYKASWGPSHDHYVESFPPYRYAWQGSARDVTP